LEKNELELSTPENKNKLKNKVKFVENLEKIF